MKKYERDDGTIFDSYDEAWEDAMQEMDIPEFYERFENRVGYWELLSWATQQPHFYDEFSDAVSDAEQDYFDDFYHEVEEEEDD